MSVAMLALRQALLVRLIELDGRKIQAIPGTPLPGDRRWTGATETRARSHVFNREKEEAGNYEDFRLTSDSRQ
jgi:hypothetical protein